ncbi:hypothetical protein EJ08DRAFT_648494 [Tothia fuscella]|uniref:Uncharacterized protein n=1 Tax=Tothia fuscella TaxID=1048955 RepID=A0A9P4TZM7_9PEZI|nr:hypothetical protein EJ08DRAFT_648494 [Tothia fuscella]
MSTPQVLMMRQTQPPRLGSVLRRSNQPIWSRPFVSSALKNGDEKTEPKLLNETEIICKLVKLRSNSSIDEELIIAEMADRGGNIHTALSSGRTKITTSEGVFLEYVPTNEDIDDEFYDGEVHKIRFDGLVEVTDVWGKFICYRPATKEDFTEGTLSDAQTGPLDDDIRLREEGFELDEYGAAILEDGAFDEDFRESVRWHRVNTFKWLEAKTHPGYDEDGNPIPGCQRGSTEPQGGKE